MHRTTLLVSLFFAIVLIQGSTDIFAQSTLPVAAYNFSEGKGESVGDVSGHNNMGRLSRGATWSKAGKYGNGIDLNGRSGHVSIPNSDSLNIEADGTMEAWVKLGTVNRWHGIIAKGSATASEAMNYAMEITEDNLIECTVGNGSEATVLDSETLLTGDAFYHIACTWDGASISIFVNGELDSSVEQNIMPQPNDAALYIGQFGGNVDRAHGIISEVRIYDRSLDPSEILVDMNTPMSLDISFAPASISFVNVSVGLLSSQAVRLTNTGGLNLSVSSAELTGDRFSLSGLSLPLTLLPGESASFTVVFAPIAATSTDGQLLIATNAPGSPFALALRGTGVDSVFGLSVSPTSIQFGNVRVGASASQIVTLSNNGTSPALVSQLIVSGSAFNVSGLETPMTISPGESAAFNAVFQPSTIGNQSGSVSMVIGERNSIATVSFSGAGQVINTRAVTLNWTPSDSAVVGYYIFRASQSSGPYTKLNLSPSADTFYADTNLFSGETYYYVITAVDADGIESTFSNESFATIP